MANLPSLAVLVLVAATTVPVVLMAANDAPGTRRPGRTLTGKDALGDVTGDAPGVRRRITFADLVLPHDTPSATNHPKIVKRPEGGFYGWPWYYIGPHQDPRHRGRHPELKDKVIVPTSCCSRTRPRST
jgi:hypothetical protein